MFYRGNTVEVFVDVTDGEPFTLSSLQYLLRSSHLFVVRSGYEGGGPHKHLRDVRPHPLWNFPGHPAIHQGWFQEVLLHDSKAIDLLVTACAWEHVMRLPDKSASRLESGTVRILAGTRLVLAECGIGWHGDPKDDFDLNLVSWNSVETVKACPPHM